MVKYGEISDLGSYLSKHIKSSINSEVRQLASKFGYREYMIARYINMFKSMEEVNELLKAFEEPLKPSIRCNRLKVHDCNYLIKRLSRLGYELEPIEWASDSYVVVKEGKPAAGGTHEFLLGLYYLYKGTASLIPPLILKPTRSDLVLDLAAAPGGKTTHMAQLMGNEGVIVAVDVNRVRMRALRTNIERLGVRNVIALRINGVKINSIFNDYFTKTLLDAPCSAEGLIQIDKTRKIKTSLDDLLRFRELQLKLLNSAIDATRGGGYILYTTCSIAPEEDELVVADIIEKRDDVKLISIPDIVGFKEGLTEYFNIELPSELRLCARTYPHVHNMEGFFLCLLKKY